MKTTIAALYRNEISHADAVKKLSEYGADDLAEFIVDAFNRGWITISNLGINEDGEII